MFSSEGAWDGWNWALLSLMCSLLEACLQLGTCRLLLADIVQLSLLFTLAGREPSRLSMHMGNARVF